MGPSFTTNVSNTADWNTSLSSNGLDTTQRTNSNSGSSLKSNGSFLSIGTIDLTALETTQETYDSSNQGSIIESSTGNGHDGSGLKDMSIGSVQTFAVNEKKSDTRSSTNGVNLHLNMYWIQQAKR